MHGLLHFLGFLCFLGRRRRLNSIMFVLSFIIFIQAIWPVNIFLIIELPYLLLGESLNVQNFFFKPNLPYTWSLQFSRQSTSDSLLYIHSNIKTWWYTSSFTIISRKLPRLISTSTVQYHFKNPFPINGNSHALFISTKINQLHLGRHNILCIYIPL